MCLEDIRIGRKTKAKAYKASLSATDGLQITANPDRVGITISDCNSVSIIAASDKANAIAGVGLLIINSTPPQPLTVKDHGQFVMGDIWLWSPGGATFCYVIEHILERE